MSHEVEQMFSVRETPWHKLGRVVQEAPTAQDAIRLAGLDWTVSKRDVFFPLNGGGPDGHAEGFKAIVRDSDNSVFAILKDSYTPLQNSSAFQFFNPFIESGLASFETAGSLRGGRNIWVLAKLNKAPIEIGKGDAIIKFLLLSNGHDGGMAVRVGFTPIRVVCANTLAMSHANGSSQLIRVLHSRNVAQRVEQLQEIVNAADAKFEATAEQYRALAKADVDQKALKNYVNIVFGYQELEEERRQIQQERITQDITRLFETGHGQELDGAKGTYWGLYNAVTQYLSYERGKTDDGRLFSLWFSDAAKINQLALDQAVKMAVRS